MQLYLNPPPPRSFPSAPLSPSNSLRKGGGWGKDSKSLQKECTFEIQKSNGNQAPLLRVFPPQLPAS